MTSPKGAESGFFGFCMLDLKFNSISIIFILFVIDNKYFTTIV